MESSYTRNQVTWNQITTWNQVEWNEVNHHNFTRISPSPRNASSWKNLSAALFVFCDCHTLTPKVLRFFFFKGGHVYQRCLAFLPLVDRDEASNVVAKLRAPVLFYGSLPKVFTAFALRSSRDSICVSFPRKGCVSGNSVFISPSLGRLIAHGTPFPLRIPGDGVSLGGFRFSFLRKVSRGPPFRRPCPLVGLSRDSISPPSEGIFGDWQGSHLW